MREREERSSGCVIIKLSIQMSAIFRNSSIHPSSSDKTIKLSLSLSQSQSHDSSSNYPNPLPQRCWRTTSRETPFSPSSFVIFPLFTIPPSSILCDYDFSFVLSQNQTRTSAVDNTTVLLLFLLFSLIHTTTYVCHMQRTLHPPAYLLPRLPKNTPYTCEEDIGMVSPHFYTTHMVAD